jgi:hypothetical protein
MLAFDLKQTRFDRGGATKSPQQARQSMTSASSIIDRGSTLPMRAPLERSVGPDIFEILNDGLVSKPVTPSAAA